jgi:hypothetical protein
MTKDTPSMKKEIKEIMTNAEEPRGYDLSTPIRKARRIIEVYMLLTQSNAQKDNILLEKREAIKLQKGKDESLKMAVRRLFSDIDESEEEMRAHHKWQPIQKIERIILLLRSEKELTSKLTSISTTGMTTKDFQRQILQCCQNIMDIERMQKTAPATADDTTIMSSNSTTVTMDKTEFDALVATSYNASKSRPRSPHQANTRRHTVDFRESRSDQQRYARAGSRDRERSRSRDRSRDRGIQRDGLRSYGDRNNRGRSPERQRESDGERRYSR